MNCRCDTSYINQAHQQNHRGEIVNVIRIIECCNTTQCVSDGYDDWLIRSSFLFFLLFSNRIKKHSGLTTAAAAIWIRDLWTRWWDLDAPSRKHESDRSRLWGGFLLKKTEKKNRCVMHSNKERSTAPHSIHLMGFMHGLLRYILYLYTHTVMKIDMPCVWQHKREQIDVKQDITLKSDRHEWPAG
jgi:hypothetical protein